MAGRGCKGIGGLCARGISHDHLRRDSTRRGKQERRTRKEDGWNQDWTEDGTGWRKKNDLRPEYTIQLLLRRALCRRPTVVGRTRTLSDYAQQVRAHYATKVGSNSVRANYRVRSGFVESKCGAP